jgi:hypothetical protein
MLAACAALQNASASPTTPNIVRMPMRQAAPERPVAKSRRFIPSQIL